MPDDATPPPGHPNDPTATIVKQPDDDASSDGILRAAALRVADPAILLPIGGVGSAVQLSVQDIDANPGATATYASTLTNDTNTDLDNLSGEIKFSAPGLLPEHATLVQKDFNGPGADQTVTFQASEADTIVGTYGPFPLLANQQGSSSHDELTLTAEAPLGDWTGGSTIKASDGTTLAHDDYVVHVT
jgi:hypothetical protein